MKPEREAGTDMRDLFERNRHVGPRNPDGYCLASDQEAYDNWLNGFRAGAEAQRERWIPVSERLPELKCNAPQMVLMAIAGRELPEMGWKLIEENRWQSVETGPHDWPIYVNMDQVTHWMPLPDPPRFAPIEGEKE